MSSPAANPPAPAAPAVAAPGSGAGNFMQNFKDKLVGFSGENGMVVLLIIICVLIFIIVIIYITFKIKGANLEGKRLVDKPVKMDKLAGPVEIAGGGIPAPAVGLEFAYSFWVYIENLEQSSTSHKMVFYRGESGNLTAANPIVMMDSVSNKMYIVIKTANSTLTDNVERGVVYTQDLRKITERNCFMDTTKTCNVADGNNAHVILTVDYIPIQRWVHVMFVVDNKLLTLYLDGQIYSVKSVDEYKGLKKLNDNLVFSQSVGNVFVGKNPTIGNGNTVTGYLSRLEYYNYSLNVSDIKKIYGKGPLSKGFLSLFGINNYGVRTPVYKLDEVQN